MGRGERVVDAGSVRVGDRIEWAGRWVEVVDWKRPRRTTGRIAFIVALGGYETGEYREVHYFVDERINTRTGRSVAHG